MNLRLMCLLASSLLFASASALASSPLTPQQCNAYPFVQTTEPVTHKDLIRELSLLESVGYRPATGDDLDYPNDIRSAEELLSAKYLADCRPAQTAAHTHSRLQ
ncbi:DUF4148 domain-containing protein [Trinickia sp. YCB016]